MAIGTMTPPKTSHHAKKIVRSGKFHSLADTDRLVSARQAWQAALTPFAGTVGQPFHGPLEVWIRLVWPWRTSDGKKVRARGEIPCIVKPDADNAAKTVLDTLVLLGIIRADQEVANLHVSKRFAERGGWSIAIDRMDP